MIQPARQAAAQTEVTTPTYDPLVEPPLPPNPTELELGRNLYWNWCMTCHGDRGQGLTDEFREIWVEDHRNCWARGCHVGRPGDQGFPIPTYVPGIVVEGHLAQFDSLQEFADYLKTTHPPQSPGILKDEEYHAIALFVFTLNGRAVETTNFRIVPAPTSTVTSTPPPAATTMSLPPEKPASELQSFMVGVLVLILLGCLGFVIRFWAKRGSAGKDR